MACQKCGKNNKSSNKICIKCRDDVVYGPETDEEAGEEKWVTEEITNKGFRYPFKIKYRNDTETKDRIIDKLLDWYKERGLFHGESIFQDEDCQIHAIEVLSDIADLFQFEEEDPS